MRGLSEATNHSQRLSRAASSMKTRMGAEYSERVTQRSAMSAASARESGSKFEIKASRRDMSFSACLS